MVLQRQEGYSLVEVLIFSAIFLVVLAAIFMLYATSHTTATWGTNKMEVQQNARVGIEPMARDARMAGYDPSGAIPLLGAPVAQNCAANPPTGSGQFAIQVACSNAISFVADVTGDGTTDRVIYRLVGSQLKREISSWNGANFPPATSSELAEGVTALSLKYYPDGGTAETTDRASIRRIEISITTQGTAGGKQETFPLTTDVRLRNLS